MLTPCTVEFVSPILLHDGHLAIDFTIAGWRYYGGDAVKAQLRPNAPLQVNLEPSNPFDHNAVLVLSGASVIERFSRCPIFFNLRLAEGVCICCNSLRICL